jgi:hypothetical protein
VRGGDRLEALERQPEMRAPLGLGHGVDLVDDHPFDRAEHLPCARGEHEVERLRRGDEHVGRCAQHLLALALRSVARADRHRHVSADPPQRCAQVALDVVGERLER